MQKQRKYKMCFVNRYINLRFLHHSNQFKYYFVFSA